MVPEAETPKREEAYRVVDSLIVNQQRRMLVNALIALGHEVVCAMPECVCASRWEFEKRGGRQISIDHILPTSAGGSDRASNLRISHLACNIATGMTQGWSQRRAQSPNKEKLAVRDRSQERGTAFMDHGELQQQVIELQHGTQEPLSRWIIEAGKAIDVSVTPRDAM